MPKYQYGCTKAEYGTFNPTTGEITGWTEFDIYQDSIVVDQSEASRTPHYKQGDPDPKVIRHARSEKTIQFAVMDTSADSKVVWLGGTKTTVEGVDTWNAPAAAVPSTIKPVRFTLEDGSVITVPQMECAGRLSGNLNESDIMLIPVVGTVKSIGIPEVSNFQWKD